MTRIMMCFILVSSCLVSCASTQKDKNRANLLLRSGTGYLSTGNYPAAMRDLLSAEQLDASNPIVQNNLGLAYFMRQKYVDAEKHIRRALDIKSDYTDARNNHGRVLIELSQYDEAIRELEKVLTDLTYAEPEKAWFNIGLAHFRKGNYPVAKEKFAEAIHINRQHCLAQTYFGRSALELGDLNLAASTLDAAVSFCKDQQHDEPHYFSGISYYKLGRTDKAVARMEEVIRLYPRGHYAKKAESMLQMMTR